MKRFLLLVGLVFGLATPASAFTYGAPANLLCPSPVGTGVTTTVNSGSNLVTAYNSASPGDVLIVHAGTFSGGTLTKNGTSGNPITICGNPSDSLTRSVIVSSQFVTTNVSFLVVRGLHFTSACQRAVDGPTNTQTWQSFMFNDCWNPGTGNTVCMYVSGDHMLNYGNDMSGCDGDCFDVGNGWEVIARNYCHDVDGSISGQHIDFVQKNGSQDPANQQHDSLIEMNIYQNCTNTGNNAGAACHGNNYGSNTTDGDGTQQIIWRFNYAQNIKASATTGSGWTWGGSGSTSTIGFVFTLFNTVATETQMDSGSGECFSYNWAPNGVALNNLLYNCQHSGDSPTSITSSTGTVANGNVAFNTAYAGSWGSPYSTEATYSTYHNLNPNFANYPTDGTLQSGSPLINAAVPLANAVGSGSSSTSLVVTSGRAGMFWPGFGVTNGDQIMIGSAGPVTVTARDTTTDTLTLGTPVSWSDGDAIRYYSLGSDNTQVLFSANGDIGAFPFNPGSSPATHGRSLRNLIIRNLSIGAAFLVWPPLYWRKRRRK